MTVLLFISTMILAFAGTAFSTLYLWMNLFSKKTDLKARNESILKFVRASMALSIVAAFLSCLLTDSGSIDAALSGVHSLFSIITICWLVVSLECCAALFVALVSKTRYTSEIYKTIKSIFSIALVGALLGILFAWLIG